MGPARRRAWIAGVVAVTASLLAAQSASAVTRYASPGGTATDDVCVTPTAPPCSIGTAASGPNVIAADEAVIQPGNYSDAAGDLNGDGSNDDGFIQPVAGHVHGVFGQPRPVISLELIPSGFPNPYGAFLLGNQTLSHVEIVSDVATSNLTLQIGAIADRVVARNGKNSAIVCNHHQGTFRNSVCLSTGSGSAGVGSSLGTAGTYTINLRNVTAVSTGAGSYGLNYFFSTFGAPGPTYTISVKGTIAQGTQHDIRARAGQFSTVNVNVDHSNYDTATAVADPNSTAVSVTPPGVGGPNFNVTDAPLLAPDGYHQLAGSPTINAGQTDGNSGTMDIDGQARQIGLPPPDIGADERAIDSTTAVTCAPAPVVSGSPTTCTATVSVAAEFITGTVQFTSSAGGAFSPVSCNVSGMAPSAQCGVTFTPAQVGDHQITSTYSGDATHEGSQGTTELAVSATPPTGGPGAGPGATRKCKKGRKLKKGKCVKKKRKKK
jgi:hypothetical protein